MTSPPEREPRSGFLLGLGAFLCWGLLPLYFRLLGSVGAIEIVADRVLWSLVLLLPVVLLLRRGGALIAALRNPKALLALAASAVLIAANWLIYVWAVLNHQVLATSLAYFLNPLINVALGVLILRERLSRVQGLAVGLAAAGVLVLAAGGSLTSLWISLSLAFSFAFYGLIRKLAPVEALEGLTIETMLLGPVALMYVLWAGASGQLVFGREAGISALLVLAGAITATPLLLFAGAARRLKFTTLGLLQYLSPTLQFVLAVTVFDEALTPARLVCFALIWSGLTLYAGSSIVAGRRNREPVCV